mmetsp:Transcript_8693/g.11998  ORF Transcript_8693/g.11998 Transcript_8693/m.11998 type:complete len:299 (-) Transcript_8693:690-1586(-)
MNSRLKELQSTDNTSKPEDTSTDNGSAFQEEQEDFMPEFFREVNPYKKKLQIIERNIKQINQLAQESLAAVGSRAQEISSSLNQIVEDTNLLATELRNYLKKMDQELQQDKQTNATELRIKKSVHKTLTVNFLKQMQDYRAAQERFDTVLKEVIKRRYITAKPNATEEEIENAIASKDTNIFANLILEDKRKKQAVDALNYIQSKHRDIIRLEESVQELFQLFTEVAVLVDYQGEIIDEIQKNVVDTANNVKKATEATAKAQKDQKKARKKKMWILALVGGIGAVAASGGTIGGVLAH